jgi:2'-5' RNA ligase
MRAFLAVELSDEIKESYRRFVDEGRRRWRELRWVRVESAHLTIRFLGETSGKQAEKLRAELEAASAALRPFRIALGAGGAFASRRVPRVLWLGVEGGKEDLSRVAREAEAAARRAGFAAERRPWNAHLTLARNPKGAAVDGWEEAAAASGLPGLSQEVDGITLFSSQLLPQGSVHTRVWRAALGAVGPAPHSTREHEQ